MTYFIQRDDNGAVLSPGYTMFDDAIEAAVVHSLHPDKHIFAVYEDDVWFNAPVALVRDGFIFDLRRPDRDIELHRND